MKITNKSLNKLVFVFCALFLTASCHKQNFSSSKRQSYKRAVFKKNSQACLYNSYPILSEEVRARLYDIPFESGCEVKALTCQSQVDQALLFITKKSFSEVKDWLDCEMEIFGWNKIMSCNGKEHCVVFEKPGKICTFLLEEIISNDQKNDQMSKSNKLIKIFVAPKKYKDYLC